jgi:hypothetical protein
VHVCISIFWRNDYFVLAAFLVGLLKEKKKYFPKNNPNQIVKYEIILCIFLRFGEY